MKVTSEMAMLLKEGAIAFEFIHEERCKPSPRHCSCVRFMARMNKIAKEIIDVTAEVV